MAKSKPQPPVAPGTAPAPAPAPAGRTAAELAEMFDQLDPVERARLEHLGAVLPQGINKDAVNGKPHWGYWCKNCNGLSMLFPGSRWGRKGEHKKPIGGLRLDEIAFIQTYRERDGSIAVKPPEQINRHNPLCGFCGASVSLGMNRSLLPDRIKAVAEHEACIDKHYSQLAKMELKSKLDQVTADIGDANQDDSYGGRAQDFLTPEARADLEHLDATGATQQLAAAVAAELRGGNS